MAEPVGYIFHRSSGKLVHPLGGSSNPGDGTALCVHDSKNDPGRLQYRFVPVEGYGHFGYIQHVSSGKAVHPKGGSVDPGNGTSLLIHSSPHAGCLFTFDEENEYIMHKGGKFWHPEGGSPSAGNGTELLLHSTTHDAMKFYFGDLNGTKISPYSNPSLSGTWKVVKAFISPKTSHTFQQTYKVGKSTSESATESHSWSISASAAYGGFSASAEYSGMVEKTSQSTWSSEYEETTTINVEAGKTIVVWQYVFGMSQYGDEHTFQSSIIGDTNSLDVKPNISS